MGVPPVSPVLEALVSGTRLTFAAMAEGADVTVEQVVALATELISKDAATVSHHPR
ncbi:hypothetical protein ACFWG6_33785 [Streptomyces erythrochromogenes]|uniref:hypothetical protein n=1 Tax=Streptomyces erythrochromogenes TaxID=285574 RepID=UPI00362EEDA6